MTCRACQKIASMSYAVWDGKQEGQSINEADPVHLQKWC